MNEAEIMSRKRGTAHSKNVTTSIVAIRKAERRYADRSRRDVAEARRLGFGGPGFEAIAAEYLKGNG